MQIRLLPIVLFAITSLLTLKAFDMIFSGAPLLGGPAPAIAANENPPAKDLKEANAAATPAKEKEAGGSLLNPAAEQRPEEKIILPKGEESAEISLNNRLGERRKQIDQREKEINMREDLVKASEKRVEDRLAELQKLEAKITADTKARDEQAGLQIKSLVMMYETMKPKDAARIFNDLDMTTMMEVTSRMNPKVTAQILAAMNAGPAQKLTVELARRSLAPQAPIALSKPAAAVTPAAGQAGPKELPRIDQKPGKV